MSENKSSKEEPNPEEPKKPTDKNGPNLEESKKSTENKEKSSEVIKKMAIDKKSDQIENKDDKSKKEAKIDPYDILKFAFGSRKLSDQYLKSISSNLDFINSNFNKSYNNDINYFKSSNDYNLHNVFGLYDPDLFQSTNKLESQINKLKNEQQVLLDKLNSEKQSTKESKLLIDKLQSNESELQRRLSLGSLLSQVNDEARKKLFESDDFLQLFETSKNCHSYVLSIDIRRSTELMLKSKKPELFERFIVTLCDKLSAIILRNYGVFDKFTGDGVLAFFPDFFSGPDAGMLAVKTALECHEIFKIHYKENRNCFVSVLQDIGLGIGIDFGKTYLVKMSGSFTVIGSPVVYACRMSGAEAGDTLLNQTAYEQIFNNYRQSFNVFETQINIKNEGNTLAYKVISNGSDLEKYSRPNWDESIKKSKEMAG